jgi:hypothetical protein
VTDQNCKPPCPYGVLVPDRDINQAEAEVYWRQDRKSLKFCRDSLNLALDFYEDLRTRLNPPED